MVSPLLTQGYYGFSLTSEFVSHPQRELLVLMPMLRDSSIFSIGILVVMRNIGRDEDYWS